ncbi:plasmid pRiA4b ORF-3 family protein [Rhodococcus pyridinivorans]|uniref:plasmid pRiA4b ORF-3 family protein n=1 Tax=Rhodococcus pyridinivorans TaxID=103816 RepID=UPI00200CC257|nr:plasmid pRiA4b ORF-3 family protein [Rhodococcus pyridinivorans]
MARTRLSVTVELLGGRGEELWPWPGRVFAVGPSHTLSDLANAMNDAFARWDRSHLSMFTLADGRVVTDTETGAEMVESLGGPITEAVDIESAKVARLLGLGAEFQFTFDLGDDWTHRCDRRRQGRPHRGGRYPLRCSRAVLGLGHHPGPVRAPVGRRRAEPAGGPTEPAASDAAARVARTGPGARTRYVRAARRYLCSRCRPVPRRGARA